MSDPSAELERWLRYEFLPRQSDGAIWKGKPAAEVALHFLQEQQELIERLRMYEPEWL